MDFTKLFHVLIKVVWFVPFCLAGYNEISRYRPLAPDERDFIDPNDFEYAKAHNITPLISSGYRPKESTLHPYVVSIRTGQPTAYFGDNHFCTGAIISTSVVITAAHCVVDGQSIVTRAKRLRVVAGSPYRLKKEATTMEFKVSRVLPHGNFKRFQGYDIALLVLSDPIPKTHAHIKMLSLAHEEPEVGTECRTLGWGQLFWDGPYADRIVYGNLSIIAAEICRRAYGVKFTKDLLCVLNPSNPMVDACRGDSGAPLICNNRLVGIVALNLICGDSRPSIFTDVTQYGDWIFNVNRGKPCKIMNMHNIFLIFILLWIVK